MTTNDSEPNTERVSAVDAATVVHRSLTRRGYQVGNLGARGDAVFVTIPVQHKTSGTKLVITVARVA